MASIIPSQMLWYLTRAIGIVSLVLLSLATVLGIVTAARAESPTWPRFAVAELHKRVALACVGILSLHVLTTVTDSFVHIGWQSIVIPFSSAYRRFWLGLGAVSVDLFVAVLVSSVFRHRISARVWRGIHWLAYASWPVAVVHSLGTGTDRHLSWMLGLVGACVAAVAGAAIWRAGIGVAVRLRTPNLPQATRTTNAVLVTTASDRDRY